MNFVKLGFVGLAMFFVASAGVSKTFEGNQTRASGPEIYRVELRNVGAFLVGAVGDPESGGELHRITVQLLEPEGTRDRQFHTVSERAPILRNTSSGERSGGGYLTINQGDYVRMGDRVGPELVDDYNLWLHTAYRHPAEGRSLTFLISVTGRELDCTGQRICNRGNTGAITFEIKIPEFRSAPSNRCDTSNTFTLTTVDGRPAIIGNSSLVAAPTISLSNTSDYSIHFPQNTYGPFLTLQNAEICVARTWR